MIAMAYLVNNTWVAIGTGYERVKISTIKSPINLIKTIKFHIITK